MMVPVHSFRDLRHSTLSLILLVAFAGIAGCANDHSSGGMSSPPDWVVVPSGGQHAKSATRDYIANGGSIPCTECHGADLSGGTSRVSCFGNPAGCHHGPVSGWIATPPVAQNHGISAKQSPVGSGFVSCQICHGSSFSGGTSGVSCYTCHGVSAPHAPKPWRGLSGSPYTHTDTAEAGNAPVCYQCHAYTGTANPNNPHVPPTPAPTGTTPGCFNGTMCHNETGHPVPFNTTTHYSVTNAAFTANCGTCHGVTGTSPVSGAPLCTTCHTAGSPLTALSCTSCHANPPTGVTMAYPNVAGAHATHMALNGTGTPVTCDTCHNGLGTTTLDHYNRANALPGENALRVSPGDAAFVSTYNAETGGTASFSSTELTCSVVSCHGGQTTPNWQTGTIDVVNDCLSCHTSGTTQYNSYNSGEHPFHLSWFGSSAGTCKLCHDATKVNFIGHLTNLATTTFEQTASSTLLTDLRYNGTSCNPQAGGLTGCHSSRKW